MPKPTSLVIRNFASTICLAAAALAPTGIQAQLAEQIGLDSKKWEECFDSQRLIPNIQAHEREALRRGANQTPTFIIGSRMIPGSISYDTFKAYVDTALAEANVAKAGS